MLVKTKFFGEVDLPEEKIITFERGLIGLADYKKFTILYDFEIDFILKSWNSPSYSGIKPWKLLLVLSYLRLNINTRYGSAYNTKKNRERYPETYHQYYTNISDDLGLNQSTIAKCVDDLVEMGIIACKHTSGFKGSANLLTGRTIFANQYKYD